MIIDPQLTVGKKGIIVVGTPRSGSHYITGALYKQCTLPNKHLLSLELFPEGVAHADNILHHIEKFKKENQDHFIFASIVQRKSKENLFRHRHLFDDYILINLRRRDKVAQYTSLRAMQIMWDKGYGTHSPNWDEIKPLLPLAVNRYDLDTFINDQDVDKHLPVDKVIYYEDLLHKDSLYTQNPHPYTTEEIFKNYNMVIDKLRSYTYDTEK